MLQLKIEGGLIETIGAAEIKMAKSTKVMSNRRLEIWTAGKGNNDRILGGSNMSMLL
jgi:hypothetical protein